jgi:hypothetical protein
MKPGAAAAAAEAAVAAAAAEAAAAAGAALGLAAEAALPLAAEAASPLAAEAAELVGELAGALPAEAAARRGEPAAGARDRLPIALTNTSPYRVRQKRPGQSMSCLQRCPRVAKPLLTIYSTRWMRRRSAPGRSFLSNSRGPEHRAR